MRDQFILRLSLAFVFVLAGMGHAQDEVKTTPDGRFTIEIETPRLPVLSQGRTGTCWSFATISFLETDLERICGKPIDLAEIYPVYFAYVEKARRFIRLGAKAQFSEGGLCHDVLHVIKRYGLAPAAAYSGLRDGARVHDHAELASMLEAVVEKAAESKRPSKTWNKAVRGLLDAYLGAVPATFVVDGREVTPQQYARDVLRVPVDSYVSVMSFKESPFWSHAELLVPDNWMRYEGYYNVPVDVFMAAFDHALSKGFSAAVDVDVSEKGFQAQRGVAELTPPLERDGAITDDLRQEMFDDKRTTDDHLMHVVGRARDKAGKVWYLTKNSWGGVGPYDGYLFMSRNYLALKMLSYTVHEDGLPQDLKKRFAP